MTVLTAEPKDPPPAEPPPGEPPPPDFPPLDPTIPHFSQ